MIIREENPNEKEMSQKKKGKFNFLVIIVLVITYMIFYYLHVDFGLISWCRLFPGHCHDVLSDNVACQYNLTKISTGLEMYSTDNCGRFPKKLSQLVPAYLNEIPKCPIAGMNTYSYQAASSPDDYTIFCCGIHHQSHGVPRNYPQYNSREGLVPR